MDTNINIGSDEPNILCLQALRRGLIFIKFYTQELRLLRCPEIPLFRHKTSPMRHADIPAEPRTPAAQPFEIAFPMNDFFYRMKMKMEVKMEKKE